jgi:hypothetical protein
LALVAGQAQRPVGLPTPKIKGWSAYHAYRDSRLSVQRAEAHDCSSAEAASQSSVRKG